MHAAFARTDHRPWPLPETAWSWRQAWVDLLFAHWPVDPELVRRLLPEPLQVDCYEGRTYVALVPFRMTGVMRRPLPDLPWISAFPEVNVRVYVTHQGKPGVWFLSLDAPNPLAVWAAQHLFHLPYYRSDISFEREGERVRYRSERHSGRAGASLWYEPRGEVHHAAPGSLEHWLTERYCLYAKSPRGVLSCCEVHHVPWPLQQARAEITHNTLFAPHGIEVRGPPPLVHFTSGVDVVMWSPYRVG